MAKKPPIRDPMGGFARLYHEVLDSPSWIALSWTAKGLYVTLRRKLNANGYNNGDISAPLSTLKAAGFKSSSTLSSGLRELLATGLLVKTRESVGVHHGSRLCCLYAFTDLPCFDIPKLSITARPATHDWRQFKTVEQAKAAIQSAESEAKARTGEKKRTVRNSNRIDSKSEPMSASDDSKFEHSPNPSVRNSKRGEHPRKRPQTTMDKGFQGVQASESQIFLTTSKFEHLSTCCHSHGESAPPIQAPEAMRTAITEHERTA